MKYWTRASVLVWFVLIAGSGCARAPLKPESNPNVEAPTQPSPVLEQMGPPSSENMPPVPYGPSDVMIRPITLVLGPGFARGFAHVGVLRALDEAKIPIAEIISTEMGACISAAYSMSLSANDFEWKMLKIKRSLFFSEGIMSYFSREQDGSEFYKAMTGIFKDRDISQGRYAIAVATRRQSDQKLTLSTSGRAATLVRAAFGIPGLMTEFILDSENGLVGTAGQVDLLGGRSPQGPVVFVDVSQAVFREPSESGLDSKFLEYLKNLTTVSRAQAAKADLVLRPNLKEMGYVDFDNRTDAIFQGKEAVRSNLKEIKHWVGLPE